MNNVSTSYLLWLACLFQFHGLHRFYNKKYVTGLLWFCTFGLFGIGQFVDLFLMRNMVEDHNIRAKLRLGLSENGLPLTQNAIALTIEQPPTLDQIAQPITRNQLNQPPTNDQLKVSLVKAAAARGGKLSVTQAVMDTGASFAEVEAAFKDLLKSGYIVIDNHPVTGAVIYDFVGL